jgi:group I intron endonuclease
MNSETQKIWAIYKIFNIENGKIYIGQTIEPAKRWYQHRRDAATPKYPLHYAINKYGASKFEFDVILNCNSQDYANWAEEELIKQYDCLVGNGKGYNISLGGCVAPKSEQWKQAMKNWHASLSPDDRAKISQKQSDATIKQIAEKGHPAAGRIVTQETRDLMRKIRLESPVEYTEEVRQRMSDSHKGKVIPEEQRIKMIAGMKIAAEARIDYSRKCESPGCEVSGKNKYIILNSIRYCLIHGQRLRRTGFLELQPRSSHNKGKKTSEEVLLKLKGRVAHNRHHFELDQINYILNCGKSMKALSRELGVTEKVIKRIRDGKY